MSGITLQIPEEFQKHAEEAAATKAVAAVEGVTESVVTTQDETEAVVEEVATAEVATVDKDVVVAEPVQRSSAKAEKFKELAEKRVNNVLNELDKLETLANARNYSYNSDQVEKIFTELQKCLDEKRMMFEGVRKPRFSFDT